HIAIVPTETLSETRRRFAFQDSCGSTSRCGSSSRTPSKTGPGLTPGSTTPGAALPTAVRLEGALPIMTHRTTARPARHQWLTVEEVCDELRVSRRSWDRWRERGDGPRAKRL